MKKKKISRLKLKVFLSFFGIVLIFALVLPISALMSIQSELELLNLDIGFPARSIAGISVFATLCGIGYGLLFTDRLVRPIKELSKNALQISGGDFTVRAKSYTKNDEMSDFVDNFNLMTEQLSKNEYLHKDFVSNVSHEFKTPVSSVMGYAEMLSVEKLSDAKRIEYAKVITRQAEKLSKLSSDMLRLSELENEKTALCKSTFALDEQIRDVLLMLQHGWEEKSIDIEIDAQEILFEGDKGLLHQVWVNILSNAIRFTDSGGKIDIVVKKDEQIQVSITDNGVGMDDEQADRVFERFYKGDTSRTGKGTGLGLPIARKIVGLHEGHISVSSKVGVGTTFTVVLPI